VAAVPCARGPHPLFFDYVFQAVKCDEILAVKDWGALDGVSGMDTNGISSGYENTRSELSADDQREKVLVIDACGVSDNEVLARAWCSHWGLGAVVANLEKTCMACAIREAYAACLNVVILVEGKWEGEEGG